MPGLEILADNARCSHVASGQIDEDELFYLRNPRHHGSASPNASINRPSRRICIG